MMHFFLRKHDILNLFICLCDKFFSFSYKNTNFYLIFVAYLSAKSLRQGSCENLSKIAAKSVITQEILVFEKVMKILFKKENIFAVFLVKYDN